MFSASLSIPSPPIAERANMSRFDFSNLVTRRKSVATITEALGHAARAVKSARRGTVMGTWSKHLAEADSELSKLQGGSVASKGLPKVTKALEAGDWEKANTALVGLAEAWVLWMEAASEKHGKGWTEIPGWADHQVPRIMGRADLTEWFVKQGEYEAKNGKKAKAKPAKSKRAAKPEAVAGDPVMVALGTLTKASVAQTAAISQMSENMSKLVDVLS